jgi:hypothetical protein
MRGSDLAALRKRKARIITPGLSGSPDQTMKQNYQEKNPRRLMQCRGGAVVLPPEGLRFLKKKTKKKPCTITSSKKNQDIDQRERSTPSSSSSSSSGVLIKPSPSIHHPPMGDCRRGTTSTSLARPTLSRRAPKEGSRGAAAASGSGSCSWTTGGRATACRCWCIPAFP